MAKKKLLIDKDVFQRVVEQLESANTFPNPSSLWKAVENTEWAKGQVPRPLTAAVAYMRAKEFGIVCATKPGKRGGTMTEARIAKLHTGGRRPRSEKMKSFTPTFAEMRATYPVTLLPLIERMEKGSLKAAVTLKCLECCGFIRAEARNCACPGCSLYPFRPSATELADVPEVAEEAEEVVPVDEVVPVAPQERPGGRVVVATVVAPVAPVVSPVVDGEYVRQAARRASVEPELTAEDKAIMEELAAEEKAALAAEVLVAA
jgi:hypothetical protein